jgi:hypothetical protein
MEPIAETINIIDSVLTEVRKMMATDLLEEDKKQEILEFVEKVLKMKPYIDLVGIDLSAILADKKIDQNDVPKMLIVILKINKMLPNLLKLKNQIPMEALKYLLFGTIYHYVLTKQKELFESIKNEEFRILFSALWQLVEYRPPTLTDVVEKVSGCC